MSEVVTEEMVREVYCSPKDRPLYLVKDNSGVWTTILFSDVPEDNAVTLNKNMVMWLTLFRESGDTQVTDFEATARRLQDMF